MKNIKLVSILENVISTVAVMDINEAKGYCYVEVERSRINGIEKTKMLREIEKCVCINQLTKYLCNALLKFEGLGMNNFKRTCKEQSINNQSYE